MAQTIDKLDQIHIGKKGAAPIAAPGWTAKSKERVKLVDCDVHHNIHDPEQLLPYLPKFYQEHLLDQGCTCPAAVTPTRPSAAPVPISKTRNSKSATSTSRLNSRRKNCSTAGISTSGC